MIDKERQIAIRQLRSLDDGNTGTMDTLMHFEKENVLGQMKTASRVLVNANLTLAGGLLNLGARDYLTRLLNVALDQHDKDSSGDTPAQDGPQ